MGSSPPGSRSRPARSSRSRSSSSGSGSTSSKPASPARARATSPRSRRSPPRCGGPRSLPSLAPWPATSTRPGRRCARRRSPRIHVFINTSDIQIAHQLRKGREQVLEQAAEMVRRAVSYTSDVEFSPMDATRSDVNFLCEIIESCIAAGATTINIPDSVGYAIPEELGRSVRGSCANASPTSTKRASASTDRTTWACARPTRSAPFRTARGRSRSRSTASASGLATPRSKRS